jgi:diguanylate cyclase (GGDEF)-like protein
MDRRTNGFVLLTAFVLITLLGVVDYKTGYEVSFAFFYLIPVTLFAWFGGIRYAIVGSVLSTITWHLANSLAGETFSNSWIQYWNAITRLGFFLVVSILVRKQRLQVEYERSISRIDFLTGVANSRAFLEFLEKELDRAKRYERPLSLAYIDLDNFKQVNDKLGHSGGDNALRLVAVTIGKQLRTTDVVARMGGDEFAVLLTETGTEAAPQIIERIHQNLLAEMKQHEMPITFSIGVVSCAHPTCSADELIKLADNLMYESKGKGKNRVEFSAG